jgi:hypothetical protein
VHQDVNLYVAEFSAEGQAASFDLKPGRMAYLLCVEGGVTLTAAPKVAAAGPAGGEAGVCPAVEAGPLDSAALGRHDAVEMQGSSSAGVVTVTVAASGLEAVEGGGTGAHVLMFEMAQDKRGGRKDI